MRWRDGRPYTSPISSRPLSGLPASRCSGDAELVAFGVGHHSPFDQVSDRRLPDDCCARSGEVRDLGANQLVSLYWICVSCSWSDIEMASILGDLALGHS